MASASRMPFRGGLRWGAARLDVFLFFIYWMGDPGLVGYGQNSGIGRPGQLELRRHWHGFQARACMAFSNVMPRR